jgi:hypothetical protein
VLAIAVLVVVALLAYARPPGVGGQPTPTLPTSADAIATPTPAVATTPTPPRGSPNLLPTPAEPTAPPEEAVVMELTNPDGPEAGESGPSDEFFEAVHVLPGYSVIWVDDNQRDYHIGLTGGFEKAIETLRDMVPRGITIYFHRYENTDEEVCALRDEILGDQQELREFGIMLNSGGCGNKENRAHIGLAPFNPEVEAFMRARYPGPVDFESAGYSTLRPYEPPTFGDVRVNGLRESEFEDLVTCGRRHFPRTALNGEPIDINADDPALASLREAIEVYGELYGNTASLEWLELERDDYGVTFVADRGDTLLEAPVFAAPNSYVPGTIDYCDPHALTLDDGGAAGVYFDPEFPAPTASSTELHVLVEEVECSSSSSPASRLLPPLVRYAEGRLDVEIRVRPVSGSVTCPGNPRLPVTIVLPEPLGDRDIRGVTAEPEY